jgi:PepSY-associated TM region
MPQTNFRKLHRNIAPTLFLPLLITALTGIAYRLGRSWFGMSEDIGEIFLVIHQGEYLGDKLKPVYVLLVGLGMIGLIVTGLSMARLFNLRSRREADSLRSVHRAIAPIIFLPLVVSAVTGIAYRLGKSWFGMTSEQAEIFLVIHQGEYLGSFLKPIYVLLVGVGLAVMLFSGIRISGTFTRDRL